jgi:hypothetical protein
MMHKLRLASHTQADDYWSGGEYEINLSFDTLRDKQWQRALETLWNYPAVDGPFEPRYVPGSTPNQVPILVPAPSDAQVQHGTLIIDSLRVGCRVLATRSLFECLSVQVPLGMFDGLPVDPGDLALFHIDALDEVYQDLALAIYEVAPFDLANIGYQCECRLVAELQADPQLCRSFFRDGSFFARDAVLESLGVWPEDFPLVCPGLRWVPPEG